jgi:transcriptional regulator with XRE-family HTH domain
MDYSRLSSQLVRALRGRRSQPAVSRRLGFDSNVLYAWESGRRAPSASKFFELAQKSRVDLSSCLPGFVREQPEGALAIASPAGVSWFVRLLGRGRSVVELARLVEADRTTVGRWLRGTTEPRLPELLALIEACTRRLLEFVALFVDPALLPASRAAYRDLLVQRELAYALPWSHAVLRGLELASYRALERHMPGFLAAELGISVQEEERYLAALVAARQVQKRRGRYVVRRVLTVDTRPSEEANRALKRHWAAVALARFAARETTKDTLFSYNLFAVSERDYGRIHALHLEYYERVREIVAASDTAERVVVLNMQLVPLSAAARASEARG